MREKKKKDAGEEESRGEKMIEGGMRIGTRQWVCEARLTEGKFTRSTGIMGC
jgi:hypothetical protein